MNIYTINHIVKYREGYSTVSKMEKTPCLNRCWTEELEPASFLAQKRRSDCAARFLVLVRQTRQIIQLVDIIF